MGTISSLPVKAADETLQAETLPEAVIGYRTVSIDENASAILPKAQSPVEKMKAVVKPDLQRQYRSQCTYGSRRLGRTIVHQRFISQLDIKLLSQHADNETVAVNFIGSIIKTAGESQEDNTPSGYILLADTLASIEANTAAHLILPCTKPEVAEAIKSGDVELPTWSLAGVDLRSGVIGALSVMGTSARTEIIRNMAKIDRETTLKYLDLVFAKWNDRTGAYGGANIMRHVLTKAGYEEVQVNAKIASTLENYLALKQELAVAKK